MRSARRPNASAGRAAPFAHMHNDSTRTTRLWSHVLHPRSYLIPSNHSPEKSLSTHPLRLRLVNLAGNASSLAPPHSSSGEPHGWRTSLCYFFFLSVELFPAFFLLDSCVGLPFLLPRRPVSPRDGPRTVAGGSCNRQRAGVDPGQPGAANVGQRSYNRPRRGLQPADGGTTGKRGCADGHGLVQML